MTQILNGLHTEIERERRALEAYRTENDPAIQQAMIVKQQQQVATLREEVASLKAQLHDLDHFPLPVARQAGQA